MTYNDNEINIYRNIKVGTQFRLVRLIHNNDQTKPKLNDECD